MAWRICAPVLPPNHPACANRVETMNWVFFTLIGAAGQTARNAMQRELTPRLGALGATLVRFLFGFPFALLFLAVVLGWTHASLPALSLDFALWILLGALTQI